MFLKTKRFNWLIILASLDVLILNLEKAWGPPDGISTLALKRKGSVHYGLLYKDGTAVRMLGLPV